MSNIESPTSNIETKSRRRRWIAALIAANAVNALVVGAILLAGWSGLTSIAQDGSSLFPDSEDPLGQPIAAGAREAEAIFREMIDELSAKRSQLEEREQQLAERERQLLVVRQELATERAEIEARFLQITAERETLETMRSPSFEQLLKAYSGMEAENAARALEQLYVQDELVVVDLLLGLKSRQAAATLDALAAANPDIAAQISYEIWKRDPDRRRR